MHVCSLTCAHRNPNTSAHVCMPVNRHVHALAAPAPEGSAHSAPHPGPRPHSPRNMWPTLGSHARHMSAGTRVPRQRLARTPSKGHTHRDSPCPVTRPGVRSLGSDTPVSTLDSHRQATLQPGGGRASGAAGRHGRETEGAPRAQRDRRPTQLRGLSEAPECRQKLPEGSWRLSLCHSPRRAGAPALGPLCGPPPAPQQPTCPGGVRPAHAPNADRP